jgi:hypothetical protein
VVRAVPWIAIVAIISLVQVLRVEYFDAIVFGATAVVLAVDAVAGPRIRAPRPPLWAVIAAAAAIGVVLALAPRRGIVMAVAVIVVGVAAIAIAWPDPVRDDPPADVRRTTRAAIAWAIVAVATCLLELGSFLVGRETAETKYLHPALSDLIDPALNLPGGTAVFGALWLALGVLLVTRGRRRSSA